MLFDRAAGVTSFVALLYFLSEDTGDTKEKWGVPLDLEPSAYARVLLIPIVFILVGGFFHWLPTLNTRKKTDGLRHFCMGIDLLVAAMIAQLLYMTDGDHDNASIQDAMAFFLLTFLALLAVAGLHIKFEHEPRRKVLRIVSLACVGNFLGFLSVASFALIMEV